MIRVMGAVLPTGTVTFLFTDVEGSTQLLHELGAAAYADALEAHRRVIRDACARHGGIEVDTQGDAFFLVFRTAPAALSAAGEMTEVLRADRIRVRVGVHTGTALVSNGDYVGVDVHRAARIAAAGHGGQVLVSEATASLAEGNFRDLGLHRFKDLLAPEHVYQLGGLAFPPIRSLERTNLPVASWPLLGRGRELDEIRNLVESGVKLVTLTGPGGSGKTRLALQAAAELSEQFLDGTFFVPLASLREAQAIPAAVAKAVGLDVDDDLVAWLATKKVLLALDNLEHLDGAPGVVSELAVGDVVVVATSRAPLHLSIEWELPIEPLSDEAAVELFVSRAAAVGRRLNGDEVVAAVCRRLDNLPLALELAAARAKLLPPAALIQRLDAALPFLTGGAVDLPERQRTLRATIEWSYDLLTPDARDTFRRLSVFRGSFTLDAAEAIAAADLEDIESLLHQSLLKSVGETRFFLLETLREYAREQLDQAAEAAEYELRHARWYLARLEEIESVLRGPRAGEFFAWFRDEEDNLRAMLDRLTRNVPVEAVRAAEILAAFWLALGRGREGRDRLQTLTESDLPPSSRAVLLRRLGDVDARLGRLDEAELACAQAVALAESSGDRRTAGLALRVLGNVSLRRGDLDNALIYGRRAFEQLDGEPAIQALALGDIGLILTAAGRDEEGRETLREAVDAFGRLGDVANVALAASNLAELDLYAGNFEAARMGSSRGRATGIETGHRELELFASLILGEALLGLDRLEDSREALRCALDLVVTDGGQGGMLYITLGVVAFAADQRNRVAAAQLRGAAAALRRANGLEQEARQAEFEQRFEQPLSTLLGADTWAQATADGAAMTLDQAIALARSLCVAGADDPPKPRT
jgi:predicted ATPase/class 3 adenylate cyclase